MWLGIPCYTKYEYSLGYKTVYNYAMPYLIVLIITGPEVMDDLKNAQTNPWPKSNHMALNSIMLNV